MPSRRLTLRDLARVAGVHYTTVSLALRNDPRLPAATRERLQALARERGYVPDPMVVSLARYRSGLRPVEYQATLAWLTAFPTREAWRKVDIFREQHAGAEARARELGYALEPFWMTEPGMTPARASQILRTRNIAGLIVAPLPKAGGTLELDWHQFPSVAIGYSLASPALHLVCAHQYRCVRLALRELKARNYRRIGLVMLRASDDRVDHNWLAGYLVEQYEASPRQRLKPLLLPAWDAAAFHAWREAARPDAIVTKLPQALPALRSAGVRIPEDLGLVLLSELHPGDHIAGVDENPRQVGAAAVDFVIGLRERHERGEPALPQRLMIDGVWIEGESVRPRVQAP